MNSSLSINLLPFLKGTALKRGAIFGSILLGALLAFEVFNFSTTQFALGDMLGDLTFAGMRWATILALAFCGIDFAGIARIFTPEQGRDEPAEVWYLFGAWLLAAGFNAMLTWWGVSVAVLEHTSAGGALLGTTFLTKGVPIFIAVMVLLVRILIIGTFSVAGERLFTLADDRSARPLERTQQPRYQPRPVAASPSTINSYPRPAPRPVAPMPRPEPAYHPVGMTASPREGNNSVRR